MGKRVCILGLLLASFAAAVVPQTGFATKTFDPGGRLKVRLPVGTITVQSGQRNKIAVHYFVRPNKHATRVPQVTPVRLDFQVHGKNATIQFSEPDKDGKDDPSIDVVVEVPTRTNLDLGLGVGKMTLDAGWAGDLHLNAGVADIVLYGGDQNRIATLDASVGVGGIEGVWGKGQHREFVGSVLHVRGRGTYHVKARVGVGSIHIDPEVSHPPSMEGIADKNSGA